MGELRCKVGEVIKQIPISLTKEESAPFIHLVDDNNFEDLCKPTMVTVKMCIYSDASVELSGDF